MEKDEKTIIEPVVDDTIDVKDVVVENPEDENPNMEQVDDNTVIEPEDVPSVEPAAEPVVDAPLADIVPPVFDVHDADKPVTEPIVPPAEDVTLAPTDDVIPAPGDTPVELPEEPAPVVSDVVPEMGDETPIDGCPGDACPGPECCDGAPTDICSTQSAMTIGNFFGTIQECVSIVWRYHLKTRKHHVHVALNEFYEKALDIVDDIIEQYQGINGVVEDPFVNCIIGDDKTESEYLLDLKNFIETNKYIMGEHSEINSTIDELFALIDSTIYKITSFTEHAVKTFDEFVYEDYAAIKESCKYDKFGEKSCDDPDDPDYDPEMENGECGGEEEE